MAMLKVTDSDRVREDVSDQITLLDDQKQCPFTDRLARGEHPGNPLFEWPVEKYSGSTSLGEVYDGQAVVASDLTNNAANRGMLQGRGMMQRHSIGVGTKVQRGTNKPGIKLGQAYDHELAIGMVELKRKVERAIVGDQNSLSETAGSQGSKTRGLTSWLRTANPGSANDLPVPSANLLPSAQVILQDAVGSITMKNLNDAMSKIFEATGRKRLTYYTPCSAAMKGRVTEFMTDAAPASGHYFPVQFNGEVAAHKVEFYVDVFVGDWGTMEFDPHNFLPTTANNAVHFIACPLDLLKIRPFFGMEHEKLPKDGSGERGFVETYWGLQVSDPTAFFIGKEDGV